MRKIALVIFLLSASARISAQGTFSGDLMMNMNFFQKDSTIRASGNPLYDNYLSGSEAWLTLRYNISGFTFFVRADGYQNSNLKTPTQGNTAFGIGAWSITKELKDFTVSVGYIYDQIGSGILYRSYEDRGLLIDNALVGFELKYKLTDKIQAKGFVGQQKNNAYEQNPDNLSQKYAPVIKAINIEGDFNAGKVHILPGVGALNRTLDQLSMSQIASSINSQELSTRFEPMYNMYAFTGYNTLTYKNFSWYLEGAYKTHEAILGLDNILIDKPGNVEYTSINYAKKGFAINLTGKRTENFVMRTSPNEILLDGELNWQPVVARLRSQRLISRYTPASQDISEQAGTIDVLLSPNDVTNITLTGTYINTLNNQELYREGYAEYDYLGQGKWAFQGGVQYMEYNQEIYQFKPLNEPIIYAVTPFAELTYRLTKNQSLRAEVEYQSTKQDYGSWAFALLEYNVAPKFSVSVSDMYNITPNGDQDSPLYVGPGITPKANNYPSIYTAYTAGPHRVSLAYVKQVDGINCSGGVCRYEPAFSGVKATLTSSF